MPQHRHAISRTPQLRCTHGEPSEKSVPTLARVGNTRRRIQVCAGVSRFKSAQARCAEANPNTKNGSGRATP